MQEEKKGNSMMIWSVTVLVIAIASYGAFKYIKKDTSISEVSSGLPVTDTNVSGQVVATSIYKNGTYSAIGEYMSPGGSEEIGVGLTLKDDVVTDATAQVKATRPQSRRYQEIFVNNFKSYVVGKKISDINLDKVSGSSLTPKGFNAALEIIKTSAKA